MKRNMRKILIFIVAAALVLTLLPMAALAEDDATQSSPPAFSAEITDNVIEEDGGADAITPQTDPAPTPITALDALTQTEFSVPFGTAQDDIPFPALTADGAELEGVTWECDAQGRASAASAMDGAGAAETYDGAAPGEYVFTPVIPAETYAVAEDVLLPAVTVTVLVEETAPSARMAPQGAAGTAVGLNAAAAKLAGPGLAALDGSMRAAQDNPDPGALTKFLNPIKYYGQEIMTELQTIEDTLSDMN